MDLTAASPRPIISPCIKVCAVDGQSGYCLGCRRTLPEIASWASKSDDERNAILAELPSRPVPVISLMTGQA